MSVSTEFAVQRIFKILPDYYKNLSTNQIEELEASSQADNPRKRFFKLEINDENFIHITYGFFGAEKIFEKANAIYELIPSIVVKPLFAVKDGSALLLAQEWFDGHALDEAFSMGIVPEKKIEETLVKLESSFKNLETESTIENAIIELNGFQEETLQNEYIKQTDQKILNDFIFPKLKNDLAIHASTVRWSGGDLIPSNILINERNEFRMVDFEFARKTHFHEEDWLRMYLFCNDEFRKTDFVQRKFQEVHPLFHSYFLIRQIMLNKVIHEKPSHINNIEFSLEELSSGRNLSSTKKDVRIRDFVNLSSLVYEQLCYKAQLEIELKRQGDQAVHVSNLETTISDIQNEISEKSTLLDQKDKDVHQLVKSVETLTADLQKSYSTAENLIAEIAKNQATIENLTAEIAKNQATIENLTAEIA
ncbi:MAG: hypothetical protein CMF43_02125, partial [Legionellales bacterium]|nr:hypothetical protein [Legionellales bacterium]